MAETIPIHRISTEGTQTRAELNDTVITEYAEAYEQGTELPPIEVYFDQDQERYFLADGFHRVEAARRISRDSIAANVHQGGRREAVLHAVGANETHGLLRTNADRRRAVLLMLDDPEWREWSNRAIARQCMVSEFLVRTARDQLAPKEAKRATEKRKAQRGGTTYSIDTGNIGAKKSEAKSPDVPTDVPETPQDAGTQPDEAIGPTAPLSAIKSQMESEAPATSTPEEPPPETPPSPEPDAQAATAAPEEPPGSIPSAAPRPDQEASQPVPNKPIPPTGSVISAEAAAKLSLETAWEWSTNPEREAFAAAHRDELRTMLAKLERQDRASS